MKWKLLSIIGIVSFSLLAVQPTFAIEKKTDKIGHIKKVEEGDSVYKFVQENQGLPWIPDHYKTIDWMERAKAFNEVLFDTKTHDYMFYTPGLFHTEEMKVGMVTLATDERKMDTTEAITLITALLSAKQVGEEFIDGKALTDLARKIEAYYHSDSGENILLNNQDLTSREQSFWQQVYPAILYFMLMDELEATENSEKLLLQLAESWYSVVMDLGGKSRAVDFAYTGYDFKEKEPYDNGEWIEADAAAGIALMQYYAFLKFGDRKYMHSTMLCMKYLDEFNHHPGHHNLYFFLPYLSARLNSRENTNFNTNKFMEYYFTETHYQNNWGWFNGLVGDRTENEGTGYLYESIMAINALVPLLKYDQRYAKEIGRYLLYTTQCLDDFFITNSVIPLNKNKNGVPSIQAGASLGLFASMINSTNVEGILRVNLNATDYYDERQQFHPTYLLFNPHESAESVNYQIEPEKTVSLFNLVTSEFVALNVQNEIDLEIPAGEAFVLVEIEIEEGDSQYDINRKVEKNVMANLNAAVNIVGLKRNEIIENDFPVELDIKLRNVGLSTITLMVDKKTVFKNVVYNEPFILDVNELSEGYHTLDVEITTHSGYKDFASGQFFVNNEKSEHILGESVKDLEKWSKLNEETSLNMSDKGLEIKGFVGSGVISPSFELDFSQRPMLEVDITNVLAPWSFVLEDIGTGEQFILVEESDASGTIKIDVNDVMKKNNKAKYNLYGSKEVRLALLGADESSVAITGLRSYYGGAKYLSEKDWKTPFTPKKMTQWESQMSGIGKLNYYNGKAYVKNLNESPSGVGGIQTDYFEVNLKKPTIFKISVEEVDELWSLLVYVEGDSKAHYLQYPTDQTGTFSYHLTEALEGVCDTDELQNVQFWIISNGDYESITKIDYLSLGYGRSWVQLTLVGLIGIITVTAILTNINRNG